MLPRAWGHFDKSELSKFAPGFSTMAISIKSLITVDLYPHGQNTLKCIGLKQSLSTSIPLMLA